MYLFIMNFHENKKSFRFHFVAMFQTRPGRIRGPAVNELDFFDVFYCYFLMNTHNTLSVKLHHQH